MVGLLVGTGDGIGVVGLLVGTDDGIGVGTGVGTSVGTSVGTGVGTGVGYAYTQLGFPEQLLQSSDGMGVGTIHAASEHDEEKLQQPKYTWSPPLLPAVLLSNQQSYV
jgi:hypothetical protein